MATLKMIVSGRPPVIVPLGTELVIGRSEDADLSVPDGGVSRRHAVIKLTTNGYVIEDLGSRNGTYVNGNKMTEHALSDRDRIEICSARFIFLVEEATASSILLQDAEPPNILGSVKVEPGQTPLGQVREEALAHLERRLKIFHKVSEAVGRTIDAPTLFEQTLEALLDVFPQAERAHVVVVDPSGRPMPVCSRCRMASPGGILGISRTVVEQTLANGEALLCADAITDERFSEAHSVVNLHIRSTMCSPLLGRERMLGAVYLDSSSTDERFTQEDLELLVDLARLIGVATDRSRLVEENISNLQLAQIGQTIAGLAHCVRNVLTNIQTGHFVLELGLQNEDIERIRAGWDVVRRSTDFLSELVLDMLAYARQRQPEYEETDLVVLLDEIVLLTQDYAKQMGASITFKPRVRYLEAKVDRTGLKRVMGNLLSNSIDACEGDSDGLVTVTLSESGSTEAIIEVTDNGCGIDQKEIDRVFEVFYTTKGDKGTGLGLPVSRKIVEEHGGKLKVESEKGRGSRFTVTMPLEPVEDPAMTKASR